MPPNLSGKVIAVSGAASGIALATAQYLYSCGASLSITDVRKDALSSAIQTIAGDEYVKYSVASDEKHAFGNTKAIQGASDGDRAISSSDAEAELQTGNGERLFAIVTDVRSSEQVDRWIERTVSHFGRLDGAANLAGVVSKHIGTSTILDLTDQDWSFMMGINLSGVFYAVRAQIRAMNRLIEEGKMEGASIVNAASTAGIEGGRSNSDYSSAKHGVVGLTRSVAKEWGAKNIRVNAVAPGIIATPMVQTLSPVLQDGIDFTIKHKQALGRRAQPVEIGKLIGFLLSEEASFISGGVYVADGGQVC